MEIMYLKTFHMFNRVIVIIFAGEMKYIRKFKSLSLEEIYQSQN